MPAKIRREAAECTSKCRSKDDAARLISVATDGGIEESVLLHRNVITLITVENFNDSRNSSKTSMTLNDMTIKS